MLIASLRHNLANLARFSGRDSKPIFLPWASLVVLLALTGASLALMATTFDTLLAPGQEAHAASSGAPATHLADRLSRTWIPLVLVETAAVLLLAGAVARRLHDRGRSGTWGLLPLPFMIASAVLMPRGFEHAMGLTELGAAETLAFAFMPLGFWVSFFVLALLVSGDGQSGPNRYGPDPRAG